MPREATGRKSSAEGARRIDRVADRVHSAAIHLLRRLRREDDASGLSAPRLSALSVVVFGGPLTLGALATAEQVRPPTMTRLVAALERDGLVRRRVDPGDARRAVVEATARGRSLIAEGRARRIGLLAGRLAALTPEELATLEQAAELLERVAGAAGDRPAAGGSLRLGRGRR